MYYKPVTAFNTGYSKEEDAVKKILWVDPDHLWAWASFLSYVMENRLFQVECLTTIDTAEIVRRCKGKRAVVIHCGTVRPMAGLREVLLAIKKRYPKIKVVLETNCTHPTVRDLVDAYIHKPLRLEEYVEILEKACR